MNTKKLVSIEEIKENTSNPRVISDFKFKNLVKSIQDFPEMLEKRPIVVDENMVVLGGNMRLKACKKAGLKEVYISIAKDWSEEKKKEFVVKDNIGYGEWEWDILANDYDLDVLENWGLDVPIEDQIDDLEDDEEIELPQSVQLEPPKEYVLIMAEPNSVDWEELKESLKLKMVRRGGYKKGSAFDSVAIERVIWWSDFKKRYVNSSTK